MYDVVFLHPPTSFRKLAYPLGGLFESATGTTDLLTMMPLGMLSLANELHSGGSETLVVNVAKKLQQLRGGSSERIEDYIGQFRSRIYGIDLHWAAHASGALDLARMCKTQDPESFVLLGGLTATYFVDEILQRYPFIDGVVRGECDGLMPDIARALLSGRSKLHEAPNLAYRKGGEIRKNPLASPDLGKVDYVDSHGLVRPAPKKERMERETLQCSIPVVRGCSQECLFCGGSRSAYRNSFHRDGLEFLSVDVVLDHIHRSLKQGVTGIKLFGDVRLAGQEYVQALLERIKELPARLDILIELFWPASREFLKPWREAARDLYLSLSPESSHPELRRLHGKAFDNQTLLEQVCLCRDLDITAWFCFAYLLPGHTPENLLQELDFIEEILVTDPSAAVMMQPYLFIDPAASVYERPDKYGFSIRLNCLAKIKESLDRAYWFHTIGYRTPDFSELDFHRAILDVTLRKAQIYFRNGRLSARDLLKTLKNVQCHREMGRLIEENPEMSDDALQEAIETIFPEYLRRSNSNLLIRPYFGESLGQLPSPEAMAYDAFPAVFELLLRSRPQAIEETHDVVEQWISSNHAELPNWLHARSLPPPLKELILGLLEPLSLPSSFVHDLLAFEWDIYRLLFFKHPDLEGIRLDTRLVLKPYGYDMICIDELVRTVAERGLHPVPAQTFYLFDLEGKHVSAANFDPRNTGSEVTNARIRRMSVIGRRLVRAEKTVLKVLSRIQNRTDPHKPEVLCDGEALSVDQVERLLFNR